MRFAGKRQRTAQCDGNLGKFRASFFPRGSTTAEIVTGSSNLPLRDCGRVASQSGRTVRGDPLTRRLLIEALRLLQVLIESLDPDAVFI